MIALTGKVIALNIAATTASAARVRRRNAGPAAWWSGIAAVVAILYFASRAL